MRAYATMLEALNDLRRQGYIIDFNIAFDKIKCIDYGFCLTTEQFEITGNYRFEGETNPSDEAVVYTIEAKDGSMKGTLVNAYGMYSDPVSGEMIRKLSMRNA